MQQIAGRNTFGAGPGGKSVFIADFLNALYIYRGVKPDGKYALLCAFAHEPDNIVSGCDCRRDRYC
jgi:hypothetical protein